MRNSLLISLVAAAALVGVASPAHAITVPGRNGDVAIATHVDCGGLGCNTQARVTLVSADGRNARRVRCPFGCSDPVQHMSFSPDGRKVLLAAGSTKVGILDVKTRKVKVLKGLQAGDIDWSADGKRLFLLSATPPRDIYSVRPDGKGLESMTERAFGIDIAASPTGHLALLDGAPSRADEPGQVRPGGNVYIVNTKRGSRRLVASSTTQSQVSLIGWTSRGRLWFVDGTGAARSVDASGGAQRTETKPAGRVAFSPDGRRIAAVEPGAVWATGLDGQHVKRLLRYGSGFAPAVAWARR